MSSAGTSGDASPGESEARERTKSALSAPDNTVAAAMLNCQQGDVLEAVTYLAVTADDGSSINYPAPNGVVLISQTCDIVQNTRPAVAAAPLVHLTDRSSAGEARAGKRPSLVHLSAIGADAFADLSVVGTVSKHLVGEQVSRHGVTTDRDIRRFGQSVGRKFSRFAFPNDVVPWLAPLERVISSKAARPDSPEGQVLALVEELRIEASPGWLSPGPLELTIVVIVAPGVLPMFAEEELPDLPNDLAAWLYNDRHRLVREVPDLAQRLVASSDPVELYWLWLMLGAAWAARCVPAGEQPPAVRNAVASVTGDVVAADEYTYDRFRRSERLDLDHLSEPLPR